ncbi:MAG TPA: hypothetical protein H9871_09800 [Candidatus Nesterenkonia stercoripullorum]|uniref:Uncharacterized protein n=1 Tax=Candidatus Nesterenkonia stercoripullorum TaxID=2838701 RepID=A0A9D1UU25_9MICC|nr:hypothetical protein [Candidatus Nesterenkonia stercoripullorum]
MMVIRTEREPSEDRLVESLRRAFDSSVMNFGSYNILFAVNSQARSTVPSSEAADPSPGRRTTQRHDLPLSADAICAFPHLLVGYRRTPAELVLCPLDLDLALTQQTLSPERTDAVVTAQQEGHVTEHPARPVPVCPLSVDLTNLAGLATTGQHAELTLSTGQLIALQIRPTWTFDQAPAVVLHQQRDVEDFYEFIDHFMDLMEGAEGFS